MNSGYNWHIKIDKVGDFLVSLCIFDLDGTLINTIEDLADSTNYVLEQHGMKIFPTEQYYYFVGNGMVKLMERVTGLSPETGLFQQIYHEMLERYNQHNMDKTKPYDGMPEVLEQLTQRRIGCAVLSNKDDRFVEALMARYFPNIQFAKLMGKRPEFPVKPDPTSLRYLMDSLGKQPQDCIYIGDSNVDVMTAHNGGLRCIGAEWGFRGRQELVDAGVDFLAENPIDILQFV